MRSDSTIPARDCLPRQSNPFEETTQSVQPKPTKHTEFHDNKKNFKFIFTFKKYQEK